METPVTEPVEGYAERHSGVAAKRKHDARVLSQAVKPLLEVMRHVMSQHWRLDKTNQQRETRAWMKSNRKEFMAAYYKEVELETKANALVVGEEKSGKEVVGEGDEGMERCLEVAERWLKERT